MKDYYEILGLDTEFKYGDLDSIYEKKLKKSPKNKAEIQEAYKAIKTNPFVHSQYSRMTTSSKQAYKDADDAIDEKNYKGAMKILQNAVKTEPCPDHLYLLLGEASILAESYTQACRAFSKVFLGLYRDSTWFTLYAVALYKKEKYSKAEEVAKEGYSLNKNIPALTTVYAETLIHLHKFKNAISILEDALNNPKFGNFKGRLLTMLSQAAFLDNGYEECINYIEQLTKCNFADDDERFGFGEQLLEILDYFMEYRMYEEAVMTTKYLSLMLPEEGELGAYKKDLDMIMKMDKLMKTFENDEAVPQIIIGVITAEMFPLEASGMTEEQKNAYVFMNEYFVLEDSQRLLKSLAYFKSQYPELYEMKAEFLDALQDPLKRKRMLRDYRNNVHLYNETFEELMLTWDEEMDEDGHEEELNSPFAIQHKTSDVKSAKVLPFVRSENKAEKKDKE